MEFIVNGVVKYNSSDGTLFCPDNTVDMITLTRVANELLLLFINNNHISLRRDDILSELWEKRGLSASSNNLNNYVSMLRKALEHCGLSGLITTLPKHGFIFDAEVVQVIKDESHKDNQYSVEKMPSETFSIDDEIETVPQVKKHISLLSLKVRGVAIFLLAIVVLFSPDIYTSIRLNLNRTEVFRIDNCHFYFLDDKTGGINKLGIINDFKGAVAKESLNCEAKTNVYYFSENMLDSLGKEYISSSLIYCPYNNKLPCENFHL
ncbi:Transcriptional regulatory protein, C terminal [Serratia quinivorans]|uniref:winged helix-turn-helix domain-containing protein n=1 Tax=Serratia quinivorans TaxID=137545 RepID=UPI00217C4C21|nr:helix-turn-helix domain-containing protein [Serratia quinivorans]CAI1871891.1 Transcriptional regulatory protein, C terminal [Serratia quinivorans]CAI1902538.1 Transcriptional regulatory protein, C terminal [Serratia quinivorans]